MIFIGQAVMGGLQMILLLICCMWVRRAKITFKSWGSKLLAVPLSAITENMKDMKMGFIEHARGIQRNKINVYLKWMSYLYLVVCLKNKELS